MSLYDDVGEFHAKFNMPHAKYSEVEDAELDFSYRRYASVPRQLTDEEFQYRMRFIQEELHEFVAAHHRGDMVSMADALADLAWVVLGTAHFMQLPFDEVWAEVRRSNMEKVLASEVDTSEHKRGRIERVRKPAGWRPPQLHEILMITTEDRR